MAGKMGQQTDHAEHCNRPALIEAARLAREAAHAPYSGFKVGAAVLTIDGAIYSGCNVENTSYGLTTCAEQNAVAAAVAGGMQPGQLKAVAIVADTAEPCTPCGACRQVLLEFACEDSKVFASNIAGEVKKFELNELLPDAFRT